MRKVNQKIILIFIMLLMILTVNSYIKVYANSEAEELIMILDEYKEELGNLDQFGEVIDTMYEDLNSATTVNSELKAKLNEDISMLAEVEGINPLILQVLDEELRAQVYSLNDENLVEMKEEIRIIKEWVAEQKKLEGEGESTQQPGPTPTQSTPTTKPTQAPSKPSNQTNSDVSISDKNIPHAGIRNVIIGSSLIFMVIFAIITVIKYKKLKNIK